MSQRRWNLVVTEQGASTPLHAVTVEAGDWMTALTRARTQIGERGGVPPGASCAVAPDGTVTLLDGVARRQYALTATAAPVSAPAAAPTTTAATAAAAPTTAAPAKKVSKATIAYLPSPLANPPTGVVPLAAPQVGSPSAVAAQAAPAAAATPASSVPASSVPAPSAPAPSAPAPSVPAPSVPAPSAPAPSAPASTSALAAAGAAPTAAAAAAPAPAPSKTKVAKHTVAYLPGTGGLPDASAPAPVSAPAPASAPAPTAAPADGAEILYSRDAEPSAESPLVYRERTFVVPAGTSADDAEMLLRRRFAALREELEARPKGKLVNMAVFDHRWEDRPSRPPLVALQWKDWKGEPEIQRPAPLASAAPASAAPPAARVAAAASAPSAPPVAAARPSTPAPGSVPPGPRSSTPGPDDRLASAFESLQDLFFLGSPLEGAEFVLNLLTDLVPHEAGSVCLYDINTDELRFVALRGPGAEARKGEAIPLGLGLIGAAAADFARPMLIEEVARDGRFDPGVDGRVGLDATTMALVPVFHSGRLQGVIQLVNRQAQAQFSKADANLLAYVGEKLGEFLQQSRMSEPGRAPAPAGTRSR